MERGGRRALPLARPLVALPKWAAGYPAGAVGCGDTGSSGAEARRDCVKPLAFAAWLQSRQGTLTALHWRFGQLGCCPGGRVVEFARVPQQNPRVFSVGKWISTECGLPHYYHLKTQRRSRRDK